MHLQRMKKFGKVRWKFARKSELLDQYQNVGNTFFSPPMHIFLHRTLVMGVTSRTIWKDVRVLVEITKFARFLESYLFSYRIWCFFVVKVYCKYNAVMINTVSVVNFFKFILHKKIFILFFIIKVYL